jgi:hypothetical protein
VAKEAARLAPVTWVRWRPYQHALKRPLLWHIDQKDTTRCGRRLSRYDTFERRDVKPKTHRCSRCELLHGRELAYR